MIKELALKNRSYRRFYQDVTIERDLLIKLVDIARVSASIGNMQPLKYILSSNREKNALIFPNLGWAKYLKDWRGPVEGERPVAYIIILGDNEITETVVCDYAIAAQSIMLGVVEAGFGGCMIASVNKKGLHEALNIPSRYEILLVLALGKPKETVMIENMSKYGDCKYWRDNDSKHHVPKRLLDDIIIG